MSISIFRARIGNEFLPLFCDHPARLYDPKGFTRNLDQVGELDATNFLRAIDAGLVSLNATGKLYEAARTKEGEQLFWEYDKHVVPRKISLSIEVVITIATISVLHFDYEWPSQDLGTQSLEPFRGAIDVMAYIDGSHPNGYIACEIKRDVRKITSLIADMQDLGSKEPAKVPKGRRYTTNRKVEALRHWRPPIFWALGPEGYGSVFRMAYSDDGRMAFEPGSVADLRCPYPAAP